MNYKLFSILANEERLNILFSLSEKSLFYSTLLKMIVQDHEAKSRLAYHIRKLRQIGLIKHDDTHYEDSAGQRPYILTELGQNTIREIKQLEKEIERQDSIEQWVAKH